MGELDSKHVGSWARSEGIICLFWCASRVFFLSLFPVSKSMELCDNLNNFLVWKWKSRHIFD